LNEKPALLKSDAAMPPYSAQVDDEPDCTSMWNAGFCRDSESEARNLQKLIATDGHFLALLGTLSKRYDASLELK
jgi:hypothetical protein